MTLFLNKIYVKSPVVSRTLIFRPNVDAARVERACGTERKLIIKLVKFTLTKKKIVLNTVHISFAHLNMWSPDASMGVVKFRKSSSKGCFEVLQFSI